MKSLVLILALLVFARPVAHAAPTEAEFAFAARAIAVTAGGAAMDRYRQSMENLAEGLAGSCAGRDALFAQAVFAWNAARPFMSGPFLEGDGLARIEYWPDKHGTGTRQLRRALHDADPGLLEPGALAQKSVALGDLQALEFLLWPVDGPVPAADSFACRLAGAVARRQRDLAADLVAKWRTAESTAAEPVSGFVRRGAELLDLIVLLKLEPVIGRYREAATPAAAEHGASGISLAAVAGGMQGLTDMYVVEGGLGDLMTAAGAAPLGAGIADLLIEATAIARALDRPLGALATDPVMRADAEDLLQRIRTIRTLWQGAMIQELGLSLGFNSLDGD
ncbi:MAG: imelysin family protein [Pseudomonadota bacterium]|nr:imelysin family protein [Pseudomonadota bacterium]